MQASEQEAEAATLEAEAERLGLAAAEVEAALLEAKQKQRDALQAVAQPVSAAARLASAPSMEHAAVIAADETRELNDSSPRRHNASSWLGEMDSWRLGALTRA